MWDLSYGEIKGWTYKITTKMLPQTVELSVLPCISVKMKDVGGSGNVSKNKRVFR